MTASEMAKQQFPLPDLLGSLGLGDHAKKSAQCPFHDDKHNSFSVWQQGGVWRWKCHAGCGCGDEIKFLELHEKLSLSDATKRFLELARVHQGDLALPSVAATVTHHQTITFNWNSCVDAFTGKHVKWLA